MRRDPHLAGLGRAGNCGRRASTRPRPAWAAGRRKRTTHPSSGVLLQVPLTGHQLMQVTEQPAASWQWSLEQLRLVPPWECVTLLE